MSENKISVKSPTRIDLAGGTLDCWPINAFLSPVSTINVAISVFTTCDLVVRKDEKIIIASPDIKQRFEFANFDEAMSCDLPEFGFFKEHIAFWAPEQGFEITTTSQSPIGGGLGGSSSLSVSLFKAFNKWLGEQIHIVDAVAYCAGIEAKILGMPTGTQDYFPAFQGGVNIIDYIAGQPLVESMPVDQLPLADCISLFYTGRSHRSGINNWQVIKDFIDKDPKTLDALGKIKDVAQDVRKAVKTNALDQLPELFQQEFAARTMLAESFCSPEIEKIASVASENGAQATKICGAGGGGCVFVWSDPGVKAKVEEACAEAGFEKIPMSFV